MSKEDAVLLGVSLVEKVLELVDEREQDEARRRIADAIDAEVRELRSSAQAALDARRGQSHD